MVGNRIVGALWSVAAWTCSIYIYIYIYISTPRGVMVKAMDCRIVVTEFEFQLRYYVHFRINTLEKGMNPLILPAMG